MNTTLKKIVLNVFNYFQILFYFPAFADHANYAVNMKGKPPDYVLLKLITNVKLVTDYAI